MARLLAPAKDPDTFVQVGYNPDARFWFRVQLGQARGPIISEEAFLPTVNALVKATAGYIAWSDPSGLGLLDRLQQYNPISV